MAQPTQSHPKVPSRSNPVQSLSIEPAAVAPLICRIAVLSVGLLCLCYVSDRRDSHSLLQPETPESVYWSNPSSPTHFHPILSSSAALYPILSRLVEPAMVPPLMCRIAVFEQFSSAEDPKTLPNPVHSHLIQSVAVPPRLCRAVALLFFTGEIVTTCFGGRRRWSICISPTHLFPPTPTQFPPILSGPIRT